MNETFLDSSIIYGNVNICDCERYRKDRGVRHGGWVELYIRSNLPHQVCENLSTQTDAEVCWVKVKPKDQNALLVGSMSRSPNTTQEYSNKIVLDSTESVSEECPEFVLLGDLIMIMLSMKVCPQIL